MVVYSRAVAQQLDRNKGIIVRITQQELKNYLSYDAETGCFFNLKTGKNPGWINDQGYHLISINNCTYRAHRLVWLYIYGFLPNTTIDHINGNRLDNKLSNLRVATLSENLQNRGPQKNNTSGYKGVSFHATSKKWVAWICIKKIKKYLGIYKTPELAYAAYCEAQSKFHPFAEVKNG